MREVYIHFIDGASIRFRAREFNPMWDGKPSPVSLSGSPTKMPTATTLQSTFS